MSLVNENECSYECVVVMDMLNGEGFMKPYAYQSLMMDVSGRHLQQFRLGVDDMLQKGMAWVLVSASIQIIRPVRSETTLIARTWHSEQDRLTFRREFCFTGEDGSPVFNAATFSVLMDIGERRIVRPETLDFDIGQPNRKFVAEASPKLRCRDEMIPVEKRKIYPSCIDRLGHTNNCRYSEFAYDALTDSEVKSLGSMRRWDVYFKSELTSGDAFTVRRSASSVGHGELIIDGVNDSTGKQSFICRAVFD